jgi:site-specific DNA recombinase
MTKSNLLAELLGDTHATDSPAPTAPLKALAWARVSTGMQEERGLSIPEQLREIRQYADRHGMEILAEYQEAASAFQREHQQVEFRRMLDRAKSEVGLGVILVHDMSRFSRDSLRAKTLVRDLRQRGIKVVSLNDPEVDPDTVAGVYMEAITFAKNEAYSREVAFHTRKGCRANIRTRDLETGWCYKNGGQPLWGYRLRQLERGIGRGGRPNVKSIWELDESVVAGRSAHKWARECIERAAKGASLDELRDFCNDSGIPGRRNRHWSTSTWHSLLQPHVLLQYCGYGVWNVHRKNGTKRPPSEWIIVENAHPPLISEETAKFIMDIRRRKRDKYDQGYGKSRRSNYLLSGGLFTCGRCGSNLIGFRNQKRPYYVCGSQPYRRGMGCGPGVYIPQALVEKEVIAGIQKLLQTSINTKKLLGKVNREIEDLWRHSTGHDSSNPKKVAAVDVKIDNIRRAIEDGLTDAAWANNRLTELQEERRLLRGLANKPVKSPRIDGTALSGYMKDLGRVLSKGTPAEQKRFIRMCVEEIKLAPEDLAVDISFRLPEPVMNDLVAGAGFEPATFGL